MNLRALADRLAQNPALLLLLIVAGGILVGVAVALLVFPLLRRLTSRTSTGIDDEIVRRARGPVSVLLPLLVLGAALSAWDLEPRLSAWLTSAFKVALPLTVCWLLVAATRVVAEVWMRHLDLEARDNLRARRLYTQIQILKRIAFFLIALLTVAVILMSFEQLRQVGTGLLASAGVAGLIVGFAAQKTLSNLLAGIQIATTQPIRIDDVVIVEGEWGRVEEITLTYVVVRIWDLRRLVVPISYFLEKPFQNWTRTSAALLGTVLVYVDYTVPVEEVRDELRRILEASELWDGETWGLQVTDSRERTVELRALMSAPDSSAAWQLRCDVREKLIEFLQREYPDALPRQRVTLAEGVESEPTSS